METIFIIIVDIFIVTEIFKSNKQTRMDTEMDLIALE